MTQALEAVREYAAVQLAPHDFVAYVQYVHAPELAKTFRGVMPSHLRRWHEHFRRPDARRKGIVAPPQSWKSSLIRWEMEWDIGHDVEERFLYLMDVAEQSVRQVVALKGTILGERYQRVFPHVQLDETRSQASNLIYLKRRSNHPDPTIYGTGWDGPYQGMHPTKTVTDDLTKQQDVTSETIMAAQRQRFSGVLLDRNPDGDWWSIFTRWGEADLYDKHKELGFLMLDQPVEGVYPTGRLLAPELFDDVWCQTTREQKGSAMYALTYLCNPSAGVGSMVKREWWRMRANPPEGYRVKVHSWDTSLGKNNLGDFTSFGAWGVTEDGYLLSDAALMRLEVPDLVKRIVTLWERDGHPLVLLEDSPVGTPVIQTLARDHKRVRVIAVKPTRDKVSRLQEHLGTIEGGRVWLMGGQPWTQEYIDQMAAFPGGAHDDHADMTSQALDWLKANGAWRPGGTGKPAILSAY